MRTRGEGGMTFLELLVTVTIMGVAFTTMLVGIAGMYTDGDSGRKLAVVETYLRRYAEQVGTTAYVACAQASDYASALTPAPPTNYGVTITTMEYWNADSSATFGTSRTACLSAGDKGVQRITITVTNSETVRPVTQTVVIEKRDQA